MAPVRYLALGDSYTIGTGASSESANFPSRLARRLEAALGGRVEVQNPAVNGYTTRDLIERELPQVQIAPDLCTILIGANDIVQGVSREAYQRNLGAIYDFVWQLRLEPGKVVGLSIPDFSAVPAATPFGTPDALRQRIGAFNAAARAEAGRRGFAFVDLTEITSARPERPGWLADDGLHPSDAQYAAWADFLWPRLEPVWVGAPPS